jgi:hypothetical protein
VVPQSDPHRSQLISAEPTAHTISVSMPDVRSARSFPSTRTSRAASRRNTSGDRRRRAERLREESRRQNCYSVELGGRAACSDAEPLAQIMTGLCLLSRRPIASCNFWIPTRGRRCRRWLFRCNRRRALRARHAIPIRILSVSAVISLVSTMEDGASSEVALIGREGMVGLSGVLGTREGTTAGPGAGRGGCAQSPNRRAAP